jgi:hypothetical protein
VPNGNQRQAYSEMSFSVDLNSLEAQLMTEVSLAAAGIRERADLQRWIERYSRDHRA